jgi:RimJ/RimL family protein N-acetyltransferase
MIEVIPATYQHVEDLAPRMRLRDKEEVLASGGFEPHAALLQSLAYSDPDLCWTAVRTDTNTPVSMFGAAPLIRGFTGMGAIWLLSSEEINQFHRPAWVLSMRHLALMHERYPVLTNYVDLRNAVSLNWLEKLGFRPVEIAVEYGTESRPFMRYESTRNV